MTNLACGKNDTVISDVDKALQQLDIEAGRLRVASWIMRCMADPMESPPRPCMSSMDVMYFMADLLNAQADDISKVANSAQDHLRAHKELGSR